MSSFLAHPVRRASDAFSRRRASVEFDESAGLVASGLCCSYGNAQAVQDASFHVRTGEAVAFLGANGSGKSTVLKALAGVMRPASGTIHFGGIKIDRLPTHEVIRLGIALVPEGRQIFVRQSVSDNLRLARMVTPQAQSFDDQLEVVLGIFPALKPKLRQPAGQLSGGQQQMLAIARALVTSPKLLLLDEPSLGLSPALMEDLTVRLQELRVQRSFAMVLVEQNAFMASVLTERTYVMQNGSIIAEHPSSEILTRSEVLSAYLGA